MLPDLVRHTEKLFYFHEIVQEESLQAAGRKLGISAATLSYSLKELEGATGVTLLVRTKKGISPTPAGQRLYDFSRKLFRDLDQIQLQISDLDQPLKTKIRIGTFSSIAIYFWPLLQDELGEQESLALSIITNRSKEILESLIKKDIEIAITVGSFQNPAIVKHELYRDSYGYYTNSSNRMADIKKSVLLFIPDAMDNDGKTLRYHVHDQGLRFKDEFELDSFEVITEFIKKGYGIGILPNKVAQRAGGNLKRIYPSSGFRNFGDHRFYLSYRNDLEIKQSDLKIIMLAATKAVTKLS